MNVRIEHLDSVWARVHCDDSIARELWERFTFEAPGFKFHPAYRAGHWDGKIRMFNLRDRTIYRGLETAIGEYAREQEYPFETPSEGDRGFHQLNLDAFIKSLKLPFPPRDYQVEALKQAIRQDRALFLSPTSSGKSLIIYMIWRLYRKKTLLIVPRVDLVEQMYGDFKDYGCDVERDVHRIKAGSEKDSDRGIFISTWQSIKDMPESWFDQFECVLGDEVHLFTAKSLAGEGTGDSRHRGIMERLTQCELRYGFTGTLSGSKTSELTLVGLFGPIMVVTTTAEMMEAGHCSQLMIEIVILEHPDWVRRETRKGTKDKPGGKIHEYSDEMVFLSSGCGPRNEFLKNLCLSLKRNTLMLFYRVEKHGKILYDMMKDAAEDVFYIHGGVKGDERNRIRLLMEDKQRAKAIASFGVFSTGTNIKNLFNIIFASGWKSRVINLQSIGRVLRLFAGKDATLYDVVDDLTWRRKPNHSMKHLQERLKIYNEEGFEYKIHRVRLEYGPQEVSFGTEKDDEE